MTIIDMQDMRYLNLFEKMTTVRTRFCLKYNNIIFFAVDKNLVSRAIGPQGKNAKSLSDILNKKIKVISNPESESLEEIKSFILKIIDPLSFRNIEMTNTELIITAGTQSKAALIGRNKRRLIELQKITKDYFRKDLKII